MRNLKRCARSLRKGDVLAYGPTWKPQSSPIVAIRKQPDGLEFTTQAGHTVWRRPGWKCAIQR